MTQIGSDIQVAVQRMIAIGGIAISDIQLWDHAADQNTPCTTGTACVFAPEGGGAAVPVLPQDISKGAIYSGTPAYIRYFEIADGATVQGINDGNPVILFTIRQLSTKTCTDLNTGLGLSGIRWNLWANVNAGHMSGYSGVGSGCVETTGLAGDWTYYHALAW